MLMNPLHLQTRFRRPEQFKYICLSSSVFNEMALLEGILDAGNDVRKLLEAIEMTPNGMYGSDSALEGVREILVNYGVRPHSREINTHMNRPNLLLANRDLFYLEPM